MNSLGHLISELRRRKVFGVAAAYAFVAWGVIEVSSTVLQMASAPAWIAKLILAVVAVGFPIALVLAWFFDLSATGFVRTPAATDGGVRPRGVPVLALLAVLGISGLLTGFAIWLRPSSKAKVEFTQLTNFSDAATAPALSPDGRMLAFLKGTGLFGNSAAPSQVYVKQLPDGDEVQLTTSNSGKATPSFSPDGSHIYFTVAQGNMGWSTHVVSVNGGHESELLPNASGLTFLDDQNVLFAEVRKGFHMGLLRATVTREAARDVYWPGEDGMAHRAAASPDRKSVLIVEMDGGIWQPCRLAPLDGSARGRQVGPPAAQCTYAAWSPDGRWMYFSSNAGGAFHLWRQRYPDGGPEQLTDGPTEEEGIAVATDGASLITSAGVRNNAISLIEGDGERQISVEGYAFKPLASKDGKRAYYLRRVGTAPLAYDVGQLVVTDLDSGAREEILPGHSMVHFDLSPDDRNLAFVSGSDDSARRGIWVAPLDLSAPPRRVFSGETERVFFHPDGDIYFLLKTPTARYMHRLRAPDYAVNERVFASPVRYLFAMSPDGEWVVGVIDGPNGRGAQQAAISTRGSPPRVICAFCGGGAGPARVMAPAISWTRDGKALLASAQFIAGGYGLRGPTNTIVVPVRPTAPLPELPAGGITSSADYLRIPGARLVPKQNVFSGATPDQLFFYESTTIRNLYRLELP